MNNNTIRLIITVYLLVSISIIGYYYINPYTDNVFFLDSRNRYKIRKFEYFKYSILVSILIGILLVSIIGYLKSINKKPNG